MSIVDERAKGGVITLVDKSIYSEAVDLNTGLQAVAVKIFHPLKLTICNIYLPPNEFIELSQLNQILQQLPSPFLIVGDFNSHSSLWDHNCIRPNTKGKIVEEFLDSNNLILLNNGAPTHFSFAYGSESAIDLSLSSPNIANLFNWTVHDDLCGSDHHPILIEYNRFIEINKRKIKWKINKADWEKFKNISMSGDFENIENQNKYIVDTLIGQAKKCIPRTSGIYKRPPVPWWTNEIHEMIQKRKTLRKNLKTSYTVQKHIEYKKVNAKVRWLIKQSKKTTWENYIKTINPKTQSKVVWSKIKKIKGCPTLSPINYLIHNNEELSNTDEVAECLADHFQEFSSNSQYSQDFLNFKNEAELSPHDKRDLTDDSYNQRFQFFELEEALKTCKGSSPGSDEIHYDMLKNISNEGKIYLLEFYNNVWSEGVLPTEWHNAIVVPIHKKDKPKTSPSSYRPISLTSCLCKLLEKMVCKRLEWYLEENHCLDNHQFGFRKNNSTLDGIIFLENEIQLAFQNKQHLVALFIDLEKAYDRTWRFHILNKVIEIGIRGQMFNFIRDFLNNRTFQVQIADFLSSKRPLENGVPQGSVLSVRLFLLAINDIVKEIESPINISLYADDICLFMRSSDMDVITNKLQYSINQVNDWMSQHGFKISPEKTTAVHFCRKRKDHSDPIIQIAGRNINFKESYRFLGVEFDRKLLWHEHIKQVRFAGNKNLNILKSLAGVNWGAHRDSLLTVHNAVVLGKINYAAPVFSFAAKTSINKLSPIHNKGLKICTGAFVTSRTKSTIVDAGHMPLNMIREKLSLNYYFKLRSNSTHPLNSYSNSVEELSSNQLGRNSFFANIKVLLTKYNLTKIKVAPIPSLPIPWIQRRTHSRPSRDPDIVSTTQLKSTIHIKILLEWQDEWNRSGEQLYQLKVTTHKWKMPLFLSRRESVVLTRLRIGHTRYTHEYLMQRNGHNMCETCSTTNSVEHVLLHCIQFEPERTRIQLDKSLHIVLRDEESKIKKLMEFLYMTKLINFL